MEDNKKNFITGGLPLGSGDFVDKSKARENKNKLLAAIDNINKVHSKKMSTENSTVANAQNFDAVGITLDMLDKENADSIKPYKKDEYILDKHIVRDEPKKEEPKNDTPQFNEPMFADLNAENFTQPMFENTEPMAVVEESESQPQAIDEFFGGDQGEPMVVLHDEQVGKKGKKVSNKNNGPTRNCSPEQVRAGKGVAWMAYIIFFLPLIFNGRNAFVRHHANEGLELNIIDLIAVGLYLAKRFVTPPNQIVELALMIGSILGLVLIAITTIAKVFLILFSFAGKEAQSPFFGKSRIIK